MHNMKHMMAAAKAKAEEVASAANEVRTRAVQQALETAGMAEKTEMEEEVPEVRKHQKLDAFLRRLYKHTDAYLRAVNGLCEASKTLVDDFSEGLEGNPAMAELAPQLSRANTEALSRQMNLLGQMLHRKVFKPIRAEVEGRKELDKRLSDRKKVRLDYDAYRRKQTNLLQNDPQNSAVYEANLEAAHRT